MAQISKDNRKKAVLELLAAGVPRTYADLRRVAGSHIPIRELLDDGLIERLPLGLYGAPERDTSWDAFSAFAVRYPSSVICLASAAAFHGLTAQNPHEIWAAFPYEQSLPRKSDLACRGFRWREAAMTVGVETYEVGGVPVRITNPARTVADFLRTMNRSGEVEHAMEALGNYTGRMSDVIKIARDLGAERTVLPYTQAVSGLGRKR